MATLRTHQTVTTAKNAKRGEIYRQLGTAEFLVFMATPTGEEIFAGSGHPFVWLEGSRYAGQLDFAPDDFRVEYVGAIVEEGS